ncbi:MAG: ATP-binding protein [Proteobacteria bacterium]|nr:ATP-binding protein [Pseudomonadota bacterium]
MAYIHRLLEQSLQHTIQRGKSVLLLGARQTGKTTLIENQLKPDLFISFADFDTRIRYERNPALLIQEVDAAKKLLNSERPFLVVVDEVQKIPMIMDVVQHMIDKKKAQFILTGSSARKLKRDSDVNLLPGRVVMLQLDALCLDELPESMCDLNKLLIYGSLPEIFLQDSDENKEIDLKSYVKIYLEEEIRTEALVRNLGSFSKFLEYAALEVGKPINFSNLSQEVGITRNTICDYYEILENCLIADRIEPITNSTTRRRLSKAPKYLFYDMGVKRLCANLGIQLPEKIMGELFEQFIGLELLRWSRLHNDKYVLRYWQDHGGAEIDYVLDVHHRYLPIEVKWSTQPDLRDARHLSKFLNEYDCFEQAYIVCRTPRRFMIDSKIMAIPWQEMPKILKEVLV